jgi:hypothetical protein
MLLTFCKCKFYLFYKRKLFIFVKNYADEGKITRSDEKRRFEVKPACRHARNQSGGNLPYFGRTQQTRIRFAPENTPTLPPNQSGLAAARQRPDVPRHGRIGPGILRKTGDLAGNRGAACPTRRTIRSGPDNQFDRQSENNGNSRKSAATENRNPETRKPDSRSKAYCHLLRRRGF